MVDSKIQSVILIISIITIFIFFILIIENFKYKQQIVNIEKKYQKEAIERGFAEYNSTNGIWQWKK